MTRYSLTLLAIAWVSIGAVAGADPHRPLCRLLLHEDGRERDERALALIVARSDLAAREELFALFDGLWKIQGIDRLTYLTGKHDRDRAKVEVERLRLLVENRQASLEQYRSLCAALGSGRSPTDAESKTIAQAWDRYVRTDCEAIAQERSEAEIDVAYYREYLASIRDLRAGEFATRQDVILAEYGVRQAEQRLDHAQGRLEACRPHAPPP